ncbi:DUF4817 domain-containing protein [Trichonephila inaurata madagascariensis]|uniref:DUF4817 domain-containing protein n=1 Tax=Trichonephila inaurata madagascariensis TaxID=2747483 RepID=A0A8X7BQ66_9ARAC|nr:DUF4817 domain-containing protein [Trichonephila inaurata madagascariensis]
MQFVVTELRGVDEKKYDKRTTEFSSPVKIKEFLKFKLGRHDPVPDRKTIHVWVENFRAIRTAMKQKPLGSPRAVTTPENVAHERASIGLSLKRSALKHATALGLPNRSLTVMVASDCYYHMIETFLQPKLKQFIEDNEEPEIWFQEDGATVHNSQRSLYILKELLPERLPSL